MTTITLDLHHPADCLPDADTYLLEPEDQQPEPRTIKLITGQRIDLAEPWRVPNVRANRATPARSNDD